MFLSFESPRFTDFWSLNLNTDQEMRVQKAKLHIKLMPKDSKVATDVRIILEIAKILQFILLQNGPFGFVMMCGPTTLFGSFKVALNPMYRFFKTLL